MLRIPVVGFEQALVRCAKLASATALVSTVVTVFGWMKGRRPGCIWHPRDDFRWIHVHCVGGSVVDGRSRYPLCDILPIALQLHHSVTNSHITHTTPQAPHYLT